MTDTTDIKALSNERLQEVKSILSGFEEGYDTVDDKENYEAMRGAQLIIDELISLRDQLESERQRAAGSEEELHKALHREKAAERKFLAAQEEIAELKGDQVPVAFTDSGSLAAIKGGHEGHIWGAPVGVYRVPLFTNPQKPVVLPEILSALYRAGFNESHRAIEVYRVNDVKAAIGAAGGIVKDGE
ncbi:MULTISPECIES: hypothetical protein [Rahnella]|uniref:Ead/Ea22-like family protein n=1 Tax=Rahnella laticis TaxID=2787622 RepID=A0ABS0DZ10_9GAMM|nr:MULTISPECIES: hypothetical protein [Rahnella]MBF7978070.1 hypothetical protein [Rahnella laticis]MBF7998213.1 hypothetical protein [Rahnella sp. LAC-M12]